MQETTALLHTADDGDPYASEERFPQIYDELKRLAKRKLAAERRGHTLQPNALVHEAFRRVVGSDPAVSWARRHHFFAAAADPSECLRHAEK